mmetsp:Transcript_25917/g.65093  ORF Transcript_25917/g.65093 Transcript_25917/m.65093 type:complete len:240 (-) Transcript_25917:2854-3573(-)
MPGTRPRTLQRLVQIHQREHMLQLRVQVEEHAQVGQRRQQIRGALAKRTVALQLGLQLAGHLLWTQVDRQSAAASRQAIHHRHQPTNALYAPPAAQADQLAELLGAHTAVPGVQLGVLGALTFRHTAANLRCGRPRERLLRRLLVVHLLLDAQNLLKTDGDFLLVTTTRGSVFLLLGIGRFRVCTGRCCFGRGWFSRVGSNLGGFHVCTLLRSNFRLSVGGHGCRCISGSLSLRQSLSV